jgi:hypothetical protein
MLAECQENEKNPFQKDMSIKINDASQLNELYINCLKFIPKIGEKNAQILVKSFKSIRISLFYFFPNEFIHDL